MKVIFPSVGISIYVFYMLMTVHCMPFCQVDGFRFDLMGHIMKSTMVRVNPCLPFLRISIYINYLHGRNSCNIMLWFPLTCLGVISSC
jgi:hypothetical protein